MKEFEKIIGYDDVKNELYRIIDIMQNRETYEKLGVTMPCGILLYGKPGVGKTTMANCFIKASKRKSFTLKKDKERGGFLDNMKSIFKEAIENQPSVIFLDDMDKFANDDTIHRNSDEYVTLQTFIDEVKNKDVFIIATANDLFNLPESLLRAGRFDNQLLLPPPEGEDAIKIIKSYISKKGFVEDIDTTLISRLMTGASCAELESVINEAGVFAGYKRKNKIDEDDLIDACIHSIYNSPLSTKSMNQNVKDHIICHEAGHAVVSEILQENSVLFISVKHNKGKTGGFTMCDKKDDYWFDIEQMENRICMILGGKAATEIMYGKADTGVQSDMNRAFDILKRFVEEYCAYGFKGYEYSEKTSEQTLAYKDEKLYSEMENLYQRAKKIITLNREFLNKIIEELSIKDILTAKDIKSIKNKCTLHI